MLVSTFLIFFSFCAHFLTHLYSVDHRRSTVHTLLGMSATPGTAWPSANPARDDKLYRQNQAHQGKIPRQNDLKKTLSHKRNPLLFQFCFFSPPRLPSTTLNSFSPDVTHVAQQPQQRKPQYAKALRHKKAAELEGIAPSLVLL